MAEKIVISADLEEISKGDETMTDYLGTIDNYNKIVEKKDKLDNKDLVRLTKVGKVLREYSSINQNPDPGSKGDIKFAVISVGSEIADLAFMTTLEPMDNGTSIASGDFSAPKE